MLLLALTAIAASRATYLLCEDPTSCPEDLAFAQGALGADVAAVDVLLELDGGGWVGAVDEKARFATGLGDAQTAVEGKKWAAAESSVDDALHALEAWGGTVPPEQLFRLWFLQGAARLGRGRDASYAYSFRQAASVADGRSFELPITDSAVTRAWLDEQRKLTVGGKGILLIEQAPEHATISVDGRALAPGTRSVHLFPGNHRLTAVMDGRLRTWNADVPVLAGRTSTVSVTFARGDDGVWVRGRLHEAFDSQTAPPEVLDLLSDWTARAGVTTLELVEVVEERRTETPTAVDVSLPVEGRPPAADGERVDMGDGVPSTFHEEVVDVHQAEITDRPLDVTRLRILYYDPVTRRIRSEPDAPQVVDVTERRFHLGGEFGYLGWEGRQHATLDLGCGWDVGVLGIEARVGVARADVAYNLTPEWVDKQIYRVAVAARWKPDWPVAPTVALGPELYVPVAVGARLSGGVEARIGSGWLARAELHGDLLDQGLGWGVGIGVGK